MVKEFVEVDALVVISKAYLVGQLCYSTNDEHVNFGLHSEIRVLELEGHNFAGSSTLYLMNLSKAG